MPVVVDAEFAERYWYPDDGGQVWLSGYQLHRPRHRGIPARDAPQLAPGRALDVRVRPERRSP